MANPFQFFDRIDQEIEENKLKLKERPVSSAPGMGGGLGGGSNGGGSEESTGKQGAYNAFFNINFDTFSTKASNYTAFSNEAPPPPTSNKSGEFVCA